MVLELPIPPSEAEFTNDVFPDRREIIAIDIALTQSRFDPNRDLTIFAERVRISDTVRTNGKALHRLAARRFRLLTIFCFASVFLSAAVIEGHAQTVLLLEDIDADDQVVIQKVTLSQAEAQELANIQASGVDPANPIHQVLAGLQAPPELIPPIGPFNVTYAKGVRVKADGADGSRVTPDQIHSLPNSDPIHVIQDYLANGAGLATGHDIVVTGGYRDPKESTAHARGAIDIRAPQTHAERMTWAKMISNQLPHKEQILVLVEEPTQMPDGSIRQVNTYFHDGVQTRQTPGIQKPAAQRGKNDQFHAQGTHIHIQVPAGFSVPNHYPVAVQPDNVPGSQVHYSNGTIYKGPLKGGVPTGQGEQVNPDGTIWSGDFTNGYGSPGQWRQTTPDGTVTDVTISADGSETFDVFASGQYTGLQKEDFKEGLPVGQGGFMGYKGSSLGGNSGWDFAGTFSDGVLKANGTSVFSNGDVAEGDFENGKLNGQGVSKYADGQVNTGQFKDGVLNGPGEITHPDGRKEFGTFKDGKLEGQGTYMSGDGEVCTGTFHNGHMNGLGKAWLNDGTFLDGNFANDNLNGEGEIAYTDGRVQQGNFSNGSLNGTGSDTLANGESVQGQFQDGKIASGTLTMPGKYTIQGPFTNGVPNGDCTITYQDGTTYTGGVVNGMKNGHGTYVPGDHSFTFTGTFKDGLPMNGTMVTKNGQTVSGDLNRNGTFVKGDVRDPDGSEHSINDNDDSKGDSADLDFKGETVKEEPDGTVSVRDNDE